MRNRVFEDDKTDPALLARIGLDNKIPKTGHNPFFGPVSEAEVQAAKAALALARANRRRNSIPAKD